jgi:signal transduction histidine kinase
MKVQKELDERDKRCRTLLEKSSEAIYCFDFERPMDIALSEEEQIDHLYKYAYISEANDAWARIAGFEHGTDLLGSRLEDIMPRSMPESIDALKALIHARYSMDNFHTVEVYKTGVKRFFINNVFGVIENGYLTRVWGTGHNITELKQIQEDLTQSKKDLQKLAGRLISNQEKELQGLARELHDDLTQQLAVIAIDAGNIIQQFRDLPPSVLSTLSNIKERLIKVSKDVHRMSRDLHPSILDDLGLLRAIKSECSNFSSRTGIAVMFTPNNIPDTVTNNIALPVYRIIQEGLSNIVKHANTKNAYVFLECNDNSILLAIRDTGTGFDPAKVRHKAALGLGSMRERARLINGKFSITSKPGKGTSIEVKIPLTTKYE